MEVNKDEAERCRDMGAEALRQGKYDRAAKLLRKSLQLYPLPGVEALLSQTERRQQRRTPSPKKSNGAATPGGGGSSASSSHMNGGDAASNGSGAAAARAGPGGGSEGGGAERGYTDEQAEIVRRVLAAKEGNSASGPRPHYRVLGVETDATDAQLKKAYRKAALKLHPDKNSAPGSDEAFKAVGLAYATLSDPQKRRIYDHSGEEDPDNRGGGMRTAGFRRAGAGGQEMSPEEIFNMFFGGMGGPGMRANMYGGNGFRVYTTGFGNGFHARHQQQRRRNGQQQQQQQGNEGGFGGFAPFFQLLPLIMLFLMSFFNMPSDTSQASTGWNQYFSLTHSPPFINPLHTKMTNVKDIPYFVTDKFMRTYHRDRYQLSKIERMVEQSYERYLHGECRNQQMYKRQLQDQAKNRKGLTAEDRERELKKAQEFKLSRCEELHDLFPARNTGS